MAKDTSKGRVKLCRSSGPKRLVEEVDAVGVQGGPGDGVGATRRGI